MVLTGKCPQRTSSNGVAGTNEWVPKFGAIFYMMKLSDASRSLLLSFNRSAVATVYKDRVEILGV